MKNHIRNLEAFDRLVDTIRNIDNSATSERGFDMVVTAFYETTTEHPCGTACCIGGWASVLTGKHTDDPDAALANMVGVSRNDAYPLCYPSYNRDDFRYDDDHPGWNATPKDAVALLLHYRATGIVDWDRAMGVEE